MADKKIKAIINGKTVMLSEAAFKIAHRYYNAVSEEELKLAKPAELQRPLIKPTMRPIIIKPPLKEVPVMQMPEEGDPKGTIIEEVKVTADVTGDPIAEKVKKAPAKRKKK